MMKKTGFTLAEVLITLSIIGIVAMMTLPALMTNVQEQQAKTGLKKGLNTVIEAAQMNQAIEGFDYGTLNSNGVGENDQSLSGILQQRTQIDPVKSSLRLEGTGNNTTVSQTPQSTAVGATGQNVAVFFRDGSALIYNRDAGDDDTARAQAADGLPFGFVVVYDINGDKAPNQLSNCQGLSGVPAANGIGVTATGDSGALSGAADIPTAGDNSNAACTRAQKVIKDQFMIRLRGTFAQPEGDAAWYAFNH